MKNLFSTAVSWGPASILMVLIFIGSQLPGSAVTLPPFSFADKAIHYTVYLILGFCIQVRICFPHWFGMELPEKRPIIWKSIVLGVLYGVSDEFHQYFVPLRDCSFFDLVADAAGILTGVFIASKFLNQCRPGQNKTDFTLKK
ncbi:MAG: VanZ family protein [Fibrobacteria bacterium]|nr:VanZ family protein [Fibrobacteria bacterium]